MSDRLLVSAIGSVIEIDASRRSADFRASALAAWADARIDEAALIDDVVVVAEGDDDEAALSMLSTEVTMKALALRRSHPLWMLHAAGVADESGRVVVLSAPSGTGKTTAARQLSQRYAYVSDETVAITAYGSVEPYRKPLSIIETHSAHKAQVALSSLGGGHPLPAALRVAKIVVLDRSPDGPARPVVEPLDAAETIELLGPQTSYLADGETPLQRIAALLEATGGAVRLRYREVTTIDGVIDDLMSTDARLVVPVSAPAAEPAADVPRPGTFSQGDVVDELDLEGRTVLLRRTPSGGRVHVLDGIGPVLWAASHARTLDELVDAVIAAHGEPAAADARSIVEAAVRRLVADGLLQETPSQAETAQAETRA